jgi:hypothetical protein
MPRGDEPRLRGPFGTFNLVLKERGEIHVPMFHAKPRRPTMMKKCYLEVAALLAMSAGAILAAGDAAEAGGSKPAAPPPEPRPYLLKPEGQQFTLLKNWTFGNQRADATVRDKAELDQLLLSLHLGEREARQVQNLLVLPSRLSRG